MTIPRTSRGAICWKFRKNSVRVFRQIKVNSVRSPISSQPAKVPGGSARNNTVNVFLKPEVYQGIPAVVKRIPLSSTYPPSIFPRFRGAKYSSNLVTLPSVRWGLFIRGVSRLSFIVDALSFLPSSVALSFSVPSLSSSLRSFSRICFRTLSLSALLLFRYHRLSSCTVPTTFRLLPILD